LTFDISKFDILTIDILDFDIRYFGSRHFFRIGRTFPPFFRVVCRNFFRSLEQLFQRRRPQDLDLGPML
jgi:hypothetical protein